MRGTIICVSVIVFPVPSLAADRPENVTADERTELLKRYRVAYHKAKAEWEVKATEARQLAKFNDTEKEGKQKLALAESALANLDKSPWASSASKVIADGLPPRGLIGRIEQGEFVVSDVRLDGVLVDGVIGAGPSPKQPVRFVIGSPLKYPKGKKEPPVMLGGLWFVAGKTEVKGKDVPVLYRFEFTKEDNEFIKSKG